MLRLLRIDAFKAYDSQSIPLEPFNVFVGQNGSGKTSVLQAIEFLHGLVATDLATQLSRHRWAYRDLPRLASPTQEFAFGAWLSLDDDDLWWSVRLGKRKHENIAAETVALLTPENIERIRRGDQPEFTDDDLFMERTGRTMRRFDATAGAWESIVQTLTSSWIATVDPRYDAERFPELAAIATWARAIQPYVVLDPNRLREPSPLTKTGIGEAGGALAGFLRHLRTNRPDAFNRVFERAKSAYPRLDKLEIQQEGTSYRLAVRESWSQDGHDPLLNARQASDGLLRIFALAALPETEVPPSLVMVDELENGVHPKLLSSLVDILEQLADDGIQVVTTSHSPLVVSFVSEPESILLTTRADDGAAQTVRLSDTPGYATLSSVFSAGEMWLARGERGLIEANRRDGA